jgi:hypothetical protein
MDAVLSGRCADGLQGNVHISSVDSGRNWAELYRQGLLEVDRAKLPCLIEQADAAIQERLLVLSQLPGHDEERRSLIDASRNLDALRRFYCKPSSSQIPL